jgi:hypothetical protein
MKRWVTSGLASTFAVTFLVGSALAAGGQQTGAGAAGQQTGTDVQQQQPVGAEKDRERLDSPAAAPRMDGERHTVRGEVTSIEKEKGKLSLRTQEGETMTLHFPQQALENIREGQQVAVEMSLRPDPSPAATPRTEPMTPGTTTTPGTGMTPGTSPTPGTGAPTTPGTGVPGTGTPGTGTPTR